LQSPLGALLRRKKEEGRGKKEEGRGKREEGRNFGVAHSWDDPVVGVVQECLPPRNPRNPRNPRSRGLGG